MKTGLLVGPDRAAILRIGVRHHARCSLPEQVIGEQADEIGAVATPDHVGLADELIDAKRQSWLLPEPGIPGAQPVALQIGEWMFPESHDELVHVGMIKIAANERV